MRPYPEILPGLLPHYALDVAHHEHLRTSENVVVKLRTAEGVCYALRIRHLRDTQPTRIRSELEVLKEFGAHARAQVPAPLATRDGKLFCVVTVGGEDYLCVVFRWVSGVHLGGADITPIHMAAMARSVAQWHAFAAAYRPPAGFDRPVYDAGWFFGPVAWTASHDFVACLPPKAVGYLRRVNDDLHTCLCGHSREPAAFGLIHYDLHVGNFLFGEGEANMLDFDECGMGFYLFDLAHILFEFVEDARFGELLQVARGEYAAARGIPLVPPEELNFFLALQGIAYLNWLYRLFWRDGHTDALSYWVPVIERRLRAAIG